MDAPLRELAETLDDLRTMTERRDAAAAASIEALVLRAEILDQRVETVGLRVEVADRRLESLDRRFDAIDRRLDDVVTVLEERFADLTRLMRRRGLKS